jgi:hypothetical protein
MVARRSIRDLIHQLRNDGFAVKLQFMAARKRSQDLRARTASLLRDSQRELARAAQLVSAHRRRGSH